MEKVKCLKVFIVDDDAMYAKALENHLHHEIDHIHVTTFGTGEACLHSMHLEPDLVLLDYMLNSEFPYAWNGLDIFRHIGRIAPYTPVVMISSQQNIDTVLQTLESGFSSYVAKNEEAFGKVAEIIMNLKETAEEEEHQKKERKDMFQVTMVILTVLFLASYFMGH